MTTDAKAADYVSYGRGYDITWEAEIAAQNFEDAEARGEYLNSLIVLREEELWILGGNVTALGQPTGLTVTGGATGGSLSDGTYKVRIFALTLEAMNRASAIARPVSSTNEYDFSTSAAPLPTVDTAVGFSVASAEGTVTLAAGTAVQKFTLSWTAIAKAAGYAVYVSTTTGAGNQKLQGVVTQTSVVVKNINTTGAADPTGGDTSADTKSFDGIIAQLNAASSGATITNVNSALSSASGNQIPEIARTIRKIYDKTKTVPARLLMGWPEHNGIDAKLSSVTSDRVKFNYSIGPEGPKPQMVQFYPSPIGGGHIPIEQTPNLPGGMILYLADSVPYPSSEVPAVWEMHMGRDLTRLNYAMTAPKLEREIRARGALAGYAPVLQGIDYNIHYSV
jgi:hypothetical protein